MEENNIQYEELGLALYSERVLAFGIDLTLALLGYFLTMKVAWPQYGLLTNPHCYNWSLLWVGVFLVYQAVANAQGRSSWGKALVGIRVCDLEGRPLSLGRSFLRTFGYLLSSLFYLGFLWPMLNRRVQGWHDLLAKSVVAQTEERGGRPLVVAGAWTVAGIVVAHWVWVFVLSSPYYRLKTVASAYRGLESVALVERDYFKTHGHYTGNVYELANQTSSPGAFLASVGMIFDVSRGFELKPEGRRGLKLSAVARDDRSTPVHLTLK